MSYLKRATTTTTREGQTCTKHNGVVFFLRLLLLLPVNKNTRGCLCQWRVKSLSPPPTKTMWWLFPFPSLWWQITHTSLETPFFSFIDIFLFFFSFLYPVAKMHHHTGGVKGRRERKKKNILRPTSCVCAAKEREELFSQPYWSLGWWLPH